MAIGTAGTGNSETQPIAKLESSVKVHNLYVAFKFRMAA